MDPSAGELDEDVSSIVIIIIINLLPVKDGKDGA